MVFLGLGYVFRDAAAEEVGFGLESEAGESVEGGRLLFCWGRGEERFGVGGEVLAAIGRIEAFRKDDEGGPGLGGFEDARTSPGKVGGFVGACSGRFGFSYYYLLGFCTGVGLELRREPVASCTRASFSGFLRRPAILPPGICGLSQTI